MKHGGRNMKVAWVNARASWSGLRARVGAFSLRERIITTLIAIVIFAGSYLVLWGFFNQQGIWMGDLFFRKVSEDRYEASGHRYPEIGSTVAVELEPGLVFRVKWQGYEWHGAWENMHFVDDDGKIIAPQQLPFWQKMPGMYQDYIELHESYFMYRLASMGAGHLEPLGYAYIPYGGSTILAVLLFWYLSPGGVHRIRGMVSNHYAYELTVEERQRMQFSAFVGIIFIVAFQLFYTSQRIISNWV